MIWKIYLIFGILAELHPAVICSPHTDVETDPGRYRYPKSVCKSKEIVFNQREVYKRP